MVVFVCVYVCVRTLKALKLNGAKNEREREGEKTSNEKMKKV